MNAERILVVDDEEEILRLLTIDLETDGYEVFTAKTGHEAIRKTWHTSPDLILLDVMLPDMNGGEVVKALKANPSTNRTPVLFLTALCSKEEERDQAELKVDNHHYLTLAKPFTSKELLIQIKKALGKE